ncbi:uncharacterized protein LOC107458351 [Arachis duranensis]|uniref:Uncharacterized protein LOC107458351 n=1 Tax=Arachis duranensis TaxID=130453 RepID=A0A6P4B4I4_ARADU|nr:uncharacterized protein LOC107458351 [Arachis duranensis]
MTVQGEGNIRNVAFNEDSITDNDQDLVPIIVQDTIIVQEHNENPIVDPVAVQENNENIIVAQDTAIILKINENPPQPQPIQQAQQPQEVLLTRSNREKRKSIYGLKQASRQCGSKYIFLVLSVDDILLASNDIDLLHETNKFQSNKFEMKDLGNASFVLGIEILRDRSQGILGLSQKNYIKKILSRYGMKSCRPMDTPVTK